MKKIEVGDTVEWNPPNGPYQRGIVKTFSAMWSIEVGRELHLVPEDMLTLVKRPCKHRKGYQPDNPRAEFVRYAYCPDCGEKL